jgi:hypothetical protein
MEVIINEGREMNQNETGTFHVIIIKYHIISWQQSKV